MSHSLVIEPIVMAVLVIPNLVIWSYLVGGVVFAAGLVTIFRGPWQNARGFDKLLLFGPVFYAAPLAAFGTEHFTVTAVIASIVPDWIPWHMFWAYFLGACFIAAGFSLATRIQARPTALLLGITFFLFVALMHGPAWAQDPHSRFTLAVALRETSFSGGALAFASSLMERNQRARLLATIARYFVAIPVLFFSVEQFLHGNYVPAIPLNRLTPDYIFGHSFWTYLAATVYVIAGILLLIGKKTRQAALAIGVTVLLIELVVYVPIGVVDRASLSTGLNYVFDTLMFCGTILLLAGAMPRNGVSS